MASKQYTDEFKAEAAKQVAQRGFAVAEVAKRLGVSSHSLYHWSTRPRAKPWRAHPRGRCCARTRTQPRCAEIAMTTWWLRAFSVH
ncbi:transposase [Stenotrophomonas sp.]|uniref:transposase n=1 Tax=Stenotrophomonas sp. TaxID=69392 RepID=UPI0028AF19FC|nr:transposase [Stenotrophomonas sp.]